MKRLTVMTLLALLLGVVGTIAQDGMSEEQLLGTMDFQRFAAFFDPEVPGTTFTTEIVADRPDGSKQAVVQVSWKFFPGEGQRARIDYLSPEELTGDTFVVTGEGIFFWNPDLFEPLKVDGRFEVFGDATVVEVVGIPFQGEYTITEQRSGAFEDGRASIELDLVAAREGVAFPQATVAADAETLQPVTLALHDEDGDLLHFNTFEEYGVSGGKPHFKRQLLDNRVVPVNQTLMIVTHVETKDLPDEMFDPAELGR